MISTYTRKLAYARRVVLVTNGTGSVDADDLDNIIGKCKEDGIELVIL